LVSIYIKVATQTEVPTTAISTSTERSKPEIIPCVTVVAYSAPKGEPIAIAGSPTFKLSDSPNSATVVTTSEEISNTANSVHGSEPTTSSSTCAPSGIIILIASAQSTTCLLVTT